MLADVGGLRLNMFVLVLELTPLFIGPAGRPDVSSGLQRCCHTRLLLTETSYKTLSSEAPRSVQDLLKSAGWGGWGGTVSIKTVRISQPIKYCLGPSRAAARRVPMKQAHSGSIATENSPSAQQPERRSWRTEPSPDACSQNRLRR